MLYHLRFYFTESQYEVVRTASDLESARTAKAELEGNPQFTGRLVIVRLSEDGVPAYEQPKERFGFKPPAPSSPVKENRVVQSRSSEKAS